MLKESQAECESEEMESEEEISPHAPSAVAVRIGKLKEATLAAVKKRERLTQPLFWSLFRSEVDSIKKRKERDRLIRQVFLGIE